MSISSNGGERKPGSLSFRGGNLRMWQVSLFLLSAAVAATIISAIFVIPTARIFSGRVNESTEALQNPVTRAEFVPISSNLVQENTGLREALSCADIHYEILSRSVGYSMPVDPGCDMKITFFDANMIKKEIPYSLNGAYHFRVEFGGKFYSLIIPP